MNCTVLPQNTNIQIKKGEKLLQALTRAGFNPDTPCGGQGICGKCLIKLVSGSLSISSEDKNLIDEAQLAEGYRLSCTAYPESDISIIIPEQTKDLRNISTSLYGLNEIKQCREGWLLAIDIGTTTLAYALVNCQTCQIEKTYSDTNHQKIFGADVISRIAAAGQGHAEELRHIILEDINNGVNIILENSDIKPDIIITGNTTMEHLLLGYDTSGLGKAPFTPVSIDRTELKYDSLMGRPDRSFNVTVMPGFTTYVGADIYAGVVACNMLKSRVPCILIDLGTNGEMALYNRSKLFITSTAAGPAFEGGNISCGMPGVSGAISKVTYNEGFIYKTIDHCNPKGLCGSGLVDAIAMAFEHNLIDETGRLDEIYFEEGLEIVKNEDDDSISLTQQDIREFQLAKAAVRAGLEILIKRAGLTIEEIGSCYLAGGFGQFINIENAIKTGMLPEKLQGCIISAGNTALAGAVRYEMEECSPEEKIILDNAEEISLSEDKDFMNAYMEYMMFGEDF